MISLNKHILLNQFFFREIIIYMIENIRFWNRMITTLHNNIKFTDIGQSIENLPGSLNHVLYLIHRGWGDHFFWFH